MKKFTTILLLFLTVTLSSCSNFLNMIPKNQQIVASMDHVKLELFAFLYTFTTEGGWNSDLSYANTPILFPLRNDMLTNFCMYGDDLVMSEFMSTPNGQKFSKGYYENVGWTGISMGGALWDDFYSSIGFMNTIERDANKFKKGNEVMFESICGEVRVVRAWYLFKLLQYFAPYHDNANGIPINLDQENIIASGRLSQTEVYSIIVRELTDVLHYTTPKEQWNVFYEKNVINAILAQVYWFKSGSAAKEESDWSNAEKYSREVMTKYTLESSVETYRDIYTPQIVTAEKNHPNLVLKFVNRDKSETGNVDGPWGQGDKQQASAELYEMYDENDIRRAAFFSPKEQEGVMINYVDKYRYGYKNSSFGDIIILFRASEMFLINAEAHARMNDTEGARAMLEEFKRAKIPGYTVFAGDKVLDEILKERRKEFCYDCDLRWLDMKRLGIASSRMGLAKEEEDLVFYQLRADDFRYAFPIPDDLELSYNTIKQNPGWENVE